MYEEILDLIKDQRRPPTESQELLIDMLKQLLEDQKVLTPAIFLEMLQNFSAEEVKSPQFAGIIEIVRSFVEIPQESISSLVG